MVGPSYLSDIAVDDIYLTKGTCCHLRQEKFDAGLIGEFLFFQMNSPSLLSLLRVRSVREGKDPDIDLARVPTRYCVLGRALPPYTKVFFARRLTMINSFFSSHMTMLEHY